MEQLEGLLEELLELLDEDLFDKELFDLLLSFFLDLEGELEEDDEGSSDEFLILFLNIIDFTQH